MPTRRRPVRAGLPTGSTRSCRTGDVLVKFRANSPGWPHVVLADFVDCFDEQALGTYRREVAALDRKLADRDHWQRFEVDAMLLELADHDGDIDRAVELLAQRRNTRSTGRLSTGCGEPAAPRRRWHGSIARWPKDGSTVMAAATLTG